MLLNSSLSSGVCYIETKSLDGETNLKHKTSVKEITQFVKSDEEAFKVQGVVECEQPNDRIYKFEGVFKTIT